MCELLKFEECSRKGLALSFVVSALLGLSGCNFSDKPLDWSSTECRPFQGVQVTGEKTSFSCALSCIRDGNCPALSEEQRRHCLQFADYYRHENASFFCPKSHPDCIEGYCWPSCPSVGGVAQLRRNGECHNPQTSREFCGEAAIRCQEGQSCQAGQCLCEPGLVDCAGKCIDPLAHNAFCGADAACENYRSCEGERRCQEGQCLCVPGRIDCAGKCIDPMSHNAFCGAKEGCQAFHPCQDGRSCQEGQCLCAPGRIDCAGKCIDPLSHSAFCGAKAGCQAFQPCQAHESCIEGQCSIKSCQNTSDCPKGYVCSGDPDHPSCVLCPDDHVICNGQCIDPKSDETYCGATENCQNFQQCQGGELCDFGVCHGPCPQGEIFCPGYITEFGSYSPRCHNPLHSKSFCGAKEGCKNYERCILDLMCVSGQCKMPLGPER